VKKLTGGFDNGLGAVLIGEHSLASFLSKKSREGISGLFQQYRPTSDLAVPTKPEVTGTLRLMQRAVDASSDGVSPIGTAIRERDSRNEDMDYLAGISLISPP